MEDKKIKVKCVNAHDRCAGSAPCPYCEPVTPPRYEDGTFAPQGPHKPVLCREAKRTGPTQEARRDDMTDDLVAHIKDRGDWLVDAVATATQNRQFLRGDPECDDVACDAIRLNGEKAMSLIAKPLSARIEALEAKLAKAVDVIEWALIAWDEHCKHGYNMQGDWVHDARATLAELTGGKDD